MPACWYCTCVFRGVLFYLSRQNPQQSPVWYLMLGLLPFIQVDDLTHLSIIRQESLTPSLTLLQLLDKPHGFHQRYYYRLHDKGLPQSANDIKAAWKHSVRTILGTT